MSIQPDETELVGSWIVVDNKVTGDDVTVHIRRLTAKELTYIAVTPDGWTRLFRDPQDGRFWEEYYPFGYMHAGGPLSLRAVTAADVREQYGADTLSEV